MGKSFKMNARNDKWRQQKQQKWQKKHKSHTKPFFIEDPKNGFPMNDTPTYETGLDFP